jgi:hypothetical protein
MVSTCVSTPMAFTGAQPKAISVTPGSSILAKDPNYWVATMTEISQGSSRCVASRTWQLRQKSSKSSSQDKFITTTKTTLTSRNGTLDNPAHLPNHTFLRANAWSYQGIRFRQDSGYNSGGGVNDLGSSLCH